MLSHCKPYNSAVQPIAKGTETSKMFIKQGIIIFWLQTYLKRDTPGQFRNESWTSSFDNAIRRGLDFDRSRRLQDTLTNVY